LGLHLHFLKMCVSRHGKVDLTRNLLQNKATWHVSIIWQTGYIPSDLDLSFYSERSQPSCEVYLRNVGFKIGENVTKSDACISARVQEFSTCGWTWPRYFRRPRTTSGRNSLCAVMVIINPEKQGTTRSWSQVPRYSWFGAAIVLRTETYEKLPPIDEQSGCFSSLSLLSIRN
jgi:hypothetical protein